MRFGALISTALLAFCGSAVFVEGARADGVPGRFDYWVLALSWSPQYCATAQKADKTQCGTQRSFGFVVHGLWPQYERGYPSQCGKATYVPEALIDRMLTIMPSKPLILHEWRKHGSCSGLDSSGYFGRIEQLYEGLTIPQRYHQLDKPLTQTPQQLEAAWLQANPRLTPQRVALQCSGPYLSELRLCYDRQFSPRDCSAEVRDRCGEQVVLRPQR